MKHFPVISGLILSALTAPPVLAETIAITNARIQSMGPAGVIDGGTLVIDNGRIVAIGKNVTPPPGARIIDAGGHITTPGLIMTGTSLGITDLPGYDVLDDVDTQDRFVSASYDARYSFNPANPMIADARADGITSALVTPDVGNGSAASPRMFGGMSIVAQMSGEPGSVMASAAGVTMLAGAAGAGGVGGGRGAEIVQFRAILSEVRRMMRSGEGSIAPEGVYGLSLIDLKALVPVVEQREPLIVSVDRVADILQILDIAQAEKIKIVLMGAREGWSVADAIARSGVPVIVDPEANIPQGLNDRLTTNENAMRLAAAGVRISFKAVHARPDFLARSPRSVVGRLVGVTGLDKDRALAALTIDAARIAGVADRTGSIEVGKHADIVIWNGDPLEAMTRPAHVLIDGREQNLETRDKLLGRRYLDQYRAMGYLPPASPSPE